MVCLALATAIGGSAANAQDPGPGRCNGRTLSGSYAFKQVGLLYAPTLTLPNGEAPRLASIGIIFFDGNGKIVMTAGMNSFGGFIVPSPPKVTGTYTFNSDCSGTISIVGPAGPDSIYFIVTDNGNHAFGLFTTPTGTAPGPVVTVDFIRQ